MRKSKCLVITIMLILAIFNFVANISHGSNLEGDNLNWEKVSDVTYNFFDGQTPTDYEVIASYGKLPELKTNEQRTNWSSRLKEIRGNLDIELSLNYTYPNGKVITYGENSRGYFVVVFYKNLTIESTMIYEIDELLNKEARKMGIQEFPVEFGSGGFPLVERDGRSEAEKKADEEYEKNGRTSYKPEIIATYGKLPELKTEEQRWRWFYRDGRAIMDSLRDKITPYMQSGPLVAFGINYDGYYQGIINRNLTAEKPLLDEIYGIIDEEAKKRGIYEVPVRFILGDAPQPSVLSSEASNKGTPPPDNKNTSLPSETSSKSVPGFGLFGGLIAMLSALLLIRK